MIIVGEHRFVETRFRDEREIEDVVLANSEHFFGASSVLIPKAKISTQDGYGTIPDGYAVDLEDRVWYVVEAELGHHDVWNHIAPQVSKQLLAANRPETGQLLVEILVQMFNADPSVRAKFEDQSIREIDVRKVLQDIFANPPILGIPIDSVPEDLSAYVQNLRNDVRLWSVRKFAELGTPGVVAYELPEESRPVLDTTYRAPVPRHTRSTYDVGIADLLQAGLLAAEDQLVMIYGPKGARRQTFTATVEADASISVDGESYASVSYAALACIQKAGSDRNTVNGWTAWRTRDGVLLADLRRRYLDIIDTQSITVMS